VAALVKLPDLQRIETMYRDLKQKGSIIINGGLFLKAFVGARIKPPQQVNQSSTLAVLSEFFDTNIVVLEGTN
jgi:hypothetical protein